MTAASTIPVQWPSRPQDFPALTGLVCSDPEEFSCFVQTEIERWGKVVRFSGAKPE